MSVVMAWCICRKRQRQHHRARQGLMQPLVIATHSRPQPPTHRTDPQMSFFERLEARVKAVDSLLCVGLDPHAAQVCTPPPPSPPPSHRANAPRLPTHAHLPPTPPTHAYSSQKPRAPRPMSSASDSSRRPCRKQRRTSLTLPFLRPWA